MRGKKPEAERGDNLATASSQPSAELAALHSRLAKLEAFFRPQAPTPGTVLIDSPALPSGNLLISQGGFESTAAVAGELVSQAEDMADDNALDHDELDPLIDKIGNAPAPSRDKIEPFQTKADGLAKRLRETLNKARAAKGKVAGAAAAAKQFKAEKIKKAEASFKEAAKLLREYDATPKAKSKDTAKNLAELLKKALEKLATDLDHLKEALEAIEDKND